MLELLYKHHPKFARPLLVKVLLILANWSDNLTEKFDLYNKILTIEPENKKATTAFQKNKQQIWQTEADEFYQRGDLENAKALYQKAGRTDKVAEIKKQMLNFDAVKEFISCLKSIVAESTNVIDTIFLYDLIDNEIIYCTENDETEKLVDTIFKQKFKNHEAKRISLSNTINAIGKNLNCGNSKYIILQTEKNIRIINFFKEEETFAVGCDSSKLSITINNYFDKSGYLDKVRKCLEQLIKGI